MRPAAGEPAELPADAVEVGRIVGAWGVKGGLKVKPFAADPQALFSSRRWYVQPNEGLLPTVSEKADRSVRLLKVIQAREQGDLIVASCHDLDDRDAAQALAGWHVYVPRGSFPTPADDEYYWVDLIGLQVIDRQDRQLGTVVGLIETGPSCVLRLQPDDPDVEERLIPFVSAYVDRVDLPARTIHVDWELDY